jgi:lysozyme
MPVAAPPAPAPTTDSAFDFGQKIVEHWEQCSLTVYHGAADRPDVWTIGWGCISMNGQKVTAATPPITQAVADQLLADELNATQTGIHSCVKVTLTSYQEAALISFVYNIGLPPFQTSTMLTLLNGGHVTEAAGQFSRWVFANSVTVKGLVRRRGAEAAVFLGKIPFGPGLDAALDQYGDAALTPVSA